MSTHERSLWLSRIIVIVLLAQPVALAQVFPDMRAKRGEMMPLGSDLVTILSAEALSESKAVLRWVGLGDADSAVDMPFPMVGGAFCVSKDTIVVSGFTETPSPVGSLCRVQMLGGVPSIAETRSLPGVDPYAVAWNQTTGVLGVLDAANQCLLVAPYWGGPLPSTSSFSIALTSAEASPLSGVDPRISVSGNGFYLRAHRLAPAGQVAWSGSGWVFTPLPSTYAPYWGVDTEAVGHATPLRVMCNGNTSFPASFLIEQLGVSSGFVGGGQQLAARTWVNVAAPQAFYDFPGASFRVVPVSPMDISASRSFRPLVRYGMPVAGGGLKPGRGTCSNDSFPGGLLEVGCPVACSTIEDGSQTPFEYTPYLWIGFGVRDGLTPDPVTVSGSVAVLDPAATMDLALVSQSWQMGGLSAQIPIPQDPGLVGLILLFQWVLQPVDDPTQLAASDVFGVRIFDAPSVASAMTAGLSGTSGALQSTAFAPSSSSSMSTFAQQLNHNRSQASVEQQNQLRSSLLGQ